MPSISFDILDKWARADRIRSEFYAEKAKVDVLLKEALVLCNSVSELRTKKKSVVRSNVRPTLKTNTNVGTK